MNIALRIGLGALFTDGEGKQISFGDRHLHFFPFGVDLNRLNTWIGILQGRGFVGREHSGNYYVDGVHVDKVQTLLDSLDNPQPLIQPSVDENNMSNQNIIDVVIITILLEEYQAVKSYLTDIEQCRGDDGIPNTHAWVTGTIPSSHGSYKIALAMAGRPGQNSGFGVTVSSVGRWKPRYIILVGVAGGMPRENLQKGDVVISSVLWGYEYGKIENGYL